MRAGLPRYAAIAAALLLGVLLLRACGRDREASVIRLAVGFEPERRSLETESFGPKLQLHPVALDADDPHSLWIGAEIPRRLWKEVSPGIWVAPRPVGNVAWMQRAGAAVDLAGGARRFTHVEWSGEMAGPEVVDPGSFTVIVDEIFLRLGEVERPPAQTTYRVCVSRGEPAGAGTSPWRVTAGHLVADGLPVWTGMAEDVSFEGLATPAMLRFATASIAAYAPADADPEAVLGEVAFRVLLDGDPLLEERQIVRAGAEIVRREVELPADASAGILTFHVGGTPALCSIIEPVLGPVTPPRASDQPDLVLFLADTFRADNLAAYGGAHGVAPNMDAFAEAGLVLREARSPAVWTLPSQASMLSGAWPMQHGATSERYSLPPEVVTIAERLQSAGYRTGAVTDGVLVSRRHGFEQGFEWFHEEWHDDFADTLGEVERFLAGADGRPTFLFVQSYRAHRPYRVTPETLEAHGARLGIDGSFDDVIARLEGAEAGWSNGDGPIPEALEQDVARLEALYRGGVFDLDRGFGELLALLDDRGLRERGYVMLTSDHGEAFGEHDLLWHAYGVWEEQIRIPLVLGGPGIEPGVVDHAATLVDVPITLAALADVPADARWEGVLLLELAEGRPSFSFECGKRPEQHLALFDGSRVVIGPQDAERLEQGEAWHAFDLAEDPDQTRDLVTTEADFSVDVLEQLVPILRPLLRPLFDPREAAIGLLDEELLRAVGY